MSPAQACKTLAHELGHCFADHETRFISRADQVICRGVAEVEAESIAYLVLASQGVNTQDYTVPYVAGWADGNIDLVKATMVRCLDASQQVLERLDTATPDGAQVVAADRVGQSRRSAAAPADREPTGTGPATAGARCERRQHDLW